MSVETFELPVSLRIRADIQRVYDSFAVASMASQWLSDRVENDLREGESTYWVFGEFRQEILTDQIRPNELIQFRWNAYGQQRETRVTIQFESVGDETRVKILESLWEMRLEHVKEALDHACGWENTLCRLKAWLEAGVQLR